MLFDQYYKDELAYLHEMGEVFAKEYPGLAPFLAQKGNDPDVERLLQGFAFLSAKIRLKLDDEFPELTHNLFSILYPNYLRSIPSTSILQFKPLKNIITGKNVMKQGIEVGSVAVDGTSCRFKTCYEVDIYPLNIESISHRCEGGLFSLSVHIKLQENIKYNSLDLDKLCFFINGDVSTAYTLYLYFFRYLENIVVKEEVQGKGNIFNLDGSYINRVGFTDNEALFTYEDSSFSGFRLIQEYFTLPEKFLFVELSGLRPVKQFSGSGNFEIKFNFNRTINNSLRINNDSLKLFCTPIVNLFSLDADPIRIKDNICQYSVRPSCNEQSHYEVFSVDTATGLAAGSNYKTNYFPFKYYESNEHGTNISYFQTNIRQSILCNGTETSINFINNQYENINYMPDVISMSLTCSNRVHAQYINLGEINIATGSSPEFVSFENIVPVTVSVSAPLNKGLHWKLISNLSMKYREYENVDKLVEMLSNHNFQIIYSQHAKRIHDLKMSGIISIKKMAKMQLIMGLPMHGYLTEIEMRSHNYSSEGEMFMFCCVLNEVFAMGKGINTYSQLLVKDLDKSEDYLWPISLMQ